MGQGISAKMLLQVIVAVYGALGMVERAISGELPAALWYGVFFAVGLRGAVSVWKEEHPEPEVKEAEPDADDYSYEAVRARWHNLQLEEKEDEERSVSDEHAFLYYQKQSLTTISPTVSTDCQADSGRQTRWRRNTRKTGRHSGR